MACETEAREKIDNLLGKSGWQVCDMKDANPETTPEAEGFSRR
jgi:hypothetical protein